MEAIRALAAKPATLSVSLGTSLLRRRCIGLLLLTTCSESKRFRNRSHPKGYAEMLERQQTQLVAGIQELYSRMRKASVWNGKPLDHPGAPPLTHDILAALDLLELEDNGSDEMEPLEDNQEAPHSDSAYGSSPQRKRQRSMSNSGERRSTPRTSQEQADVHLPIIQPLHSTMTNDSPKAFTASSPPRMHQIQHYPTQTPLSLLEAQEAPTQPWPPAPTIPTEPPALHPLPSESISSTLPSPTAIPTLLSEPQLYSPGWSQLLSDKSIRQDLDLSDYESAPLIAQPTALTQNPSTTQGKFTCNREPCIWKRRLGSGIGLDQPNFMTDYVSLIGLDLTAVQPWKALGAQDVAVS